MPVSDFIFYIKDTYSNISTPLKESPTLPTNYLPTKRFSERVISVLKGSLYGAGRTWYLALRSPTLATYHDRNATLFKDKPKSKEKCTIDYPKSLQTV